MFWNWNLRYFLWESWNTHLWGQDSSDSPLVWEECVPCPNLPVWTSPTGHGCSVIWDLILVEVCCSDSEQIGLIDIEWPSNFSTSFNLSLAERFGVLNLLLFSLVASDGVHNLVEFGNPSLFEAQIDRALVFFQFWKKYTRRPDGVETGGIILYKWVELSLWRRFC